jgi:hypothetical protein
MESIRKQDRITKEECNGILKEYLKHKSFDWDKIQENIYREDIT